MDWIFVLLATGSGVVFAVGDILLKFWANKPNVSFMVSAFILYIIAGFLLAYSFRRREIAVALAVLLCANLLLVTIIGFTVFKETLGLKEMIGVTLTMISIILLTV